MKGIILAAGSGTRLSPATIPTSKVLLPIFDRPMIYYPLSTLMLASVKEILVIANERDVVSFKRTLGDGSQFGIKIDYDIQYVQRGISDAFIIAEKWIGEEEVVLILGDNIFYGDSLESLIKKATVSNKDATIFGYYVDDPHRFGIVEFDNDLNVLSLKEKPQHTNSNYAVVGLYFYKKGASEIAKTLTPSKRGELEITDLNNVYLNNDDLSVILMDEKIKWIDAGTFDSLLKASLFISDEEKTKKKKIMCPEIIAYEKGFVSREKLIEWVKANPNSDYYKMILNELTIE